MVHSRSMQILIERSKVRKKGREREGIRGGKKGKRRERREEGGKEERTQRIRDYLESRISHSWQSHSVFLERLLNRL